MEVPPTFDLAVGDGFLLRKLYTIKNKNQKRKITVGTTFLLTLSRLITTENKKIYIPGRNSSIGDDIVRIFSRKNKGNFVLKTKTSVYYLIILKKKD